MEPETTVQPTLWNRMYRAVWKRFLDIMLSALALAVLSPFLLVLAALVKLTSPGPVLFCQRRVGRGRREFLMWKYRSMRTDAPSDVPTHLLRNAKGHITPLGLFLRKYSLDELPQLVNVLRGQMSIVGPRPALWNQDDLVAERERYGANDLRPGLTGWAQVQGRDELPIPVKAEKDGWYAAHCSFVLDVRVVWFTVARVLTAHGVVEGAGERHP